MYTIEVAGSRRALEEDKHEESAVRDRETAVRDPV